jgi:hypothetical protein
MGAYLFDEIHEGGDGVPLDVELSGDHSLEVTHILIADMALVRAWVDGDTLCPEALAVQRDLDEVGDVAATSITQGSYLIYIDA